MILQKKERKRKKEARPLQWSRKAGGERQLYYAALPQMYKTNNVLRQHFNTKRLGWGEMQDIQGSLETIVSANLYEVFWLIQGLQPSPTFPNTLTVLAAQQQYQTKLHFQVWNLPSHTERFLLAIGILKHFLIFAVEGFVHFRCLCSCHVYIKPCFVVQHYCKTI